MKSKDGNSKQDAVTFRKPVEKSSIGQQEEHKVVPKTPIAPPLEAKEEDVPTPIALHQEIKGIPYTAVYFKVEKIWDDPDISLKDDVEMIEKHYQQKVSAGDLEDGEKTFIKLVKEAEKATDCQDAPANVRIAKIAEFFRFMNRLDKIDKERRRWQ